MPALPGIAPSVAMARRRGLRVALPWLFALIAALAQALAPTLLRAGASMADERGLDAVLRALCTQSPTVTVEGQSTAADQGGALPTLAMVGDCPWCLLGAAPPPSDVTAEAPAFDSAARAAPRPPARPRTGAVLAAAEARGPPARPLPALA